MNDHAVVVRLRQAALELASAGPDEKLTVSSICAAAGVSRDDFYSAASNPIQLLGEALSDELLSALDDLPNWPEQVSGTGLKRDGIKPIRRRVGATVVFADTQIGDAARAEVSGDPAGIGRGASRFTSVQGKAHSAICWYGAIDLVGDF